MERDCEGRVFVITGANAGIGRVTAHTIAQRGGTVIMACRSAERAEPVVEDIKRETGNPNVRFIPLDLASLESVRTCALRILDEEPAIHVLINNAGVAGIQGQTKDGFELAFGVNHLGHYLFTRLLLDRIKTSAPARIVNVASRAHTRATHYDLGAVQQPTASTTGLPEYGVSKLANVLFTQELAKRLEGTGVPTYAVQPGVVASEIGKRVPGVFRWFIKLFMISNEEGAQTSLHCALSEEAGKETGLYYDKCKPITPHAMAQDEARATQLWEQSEEWVAAFLK
jgi:retinol dehydrogenase-12